MQHLILKQPAGNRMRVLCLGAHCDDIEIGCGGTILRLVEENPGIEILWKVFSSNKVRKKEAEKSAVLFTGKKTKIKCIIGDYRDGFFPYLGYQIKEDFEALKTKFSPDLVITHHRDDLHQDHRLISELTWNTFRDHLILEYEVPKYDGGLGTPNLYVPIDDKVCSKKLNLILGAFESQKQKSWFTEDSFRSILRLRGIESNSLYAEAFYCRKFILGFPTNLPDGSAVKGSRIKSRH